MSDPRHPFGEYRDAYLRLHSSPGLRRVHFVASTGAVGCLLAGLVTRRVTPLLAAPLVLFVPTWLSRRALGAGPLPPSPAPVLHAALAAFEMWWRSLDGSLDGEVARVALRDEREQKAARRAARRREATVSPAPNMMTDNTLH